MHPRITLSVGNFFFEISSIITIFIAIPYLSAFIGNTYASLVIAGGALISIIGFPMLPRYTARFGAQTLAIFLALLQILVLLALAAVPNAIVAVIGIALIIALQPFLYYTFDLLLAAVTLQKGMTGKVRTLFLTVGNVATAGAPLLMGALLLDTNDYSRVFLAVAVVIIPIVILFAGRKLPTGKPPKELHFGSALRTIFHDRNLSAVISAHFFLDLFYMWAPLYTPIYLHNVLGIPWGQLGWIFSVMLLPFVFVEYPAGVISDRFHTDKKLMALGFIIMGSTFALVPIITTTTSVLIILAILVSSRVGAALVEAMTETHFFRSVSEQDSEEIAAFRDTWPFANLIAPLTASVFFFMSGFSLFFISTGVFLMVAGAIASLLIRTTY
ncbi:MAG TPA: MFS transporter [Candidatus Kaiserbacteria bacterium]|nr:MFS transporter [Candidatus Kaiserbacteria bacterium]